MKQIVRCIGCECRLKKRNFGRGSTKPTCADCSARHHRERNVARIRNIRAADPAYRERERKMLRERMAELRATPGYVRPDSAAARKGRRVWKRRSPKR